MALPTSPVPEYGYTMKLSVIHGCFLCYNRKDKRWFGLVSLANGKWKVMVAQGAANRET